MLTSDGECLRKYLLVDDASLSCLSTFRLEHFELQIASHCWALPALLALWTRDGELAKLAELYIQNAAFFWFFVIEHGCSMGAMSVVCLAFQDVLFLNVVNVGFPATSLFERRAIWYVYYMHGMYTISGSRTLMHGISEYALGHAIGLQSHAVLTQTVHINNNKEWDTRWLTSKRALSKEQCSICISLPQHENTTCSTCNNMCSIDACDKTTTCLLQQR